MSLSTSSTHNPIPNTTATTNRHVTPTIYDRLGYVTTGPGENYYRWCLTDVDAIELKDMISKLKKESTIGFIEKLKKEYELLCTEDHDELTRLYPDFINKVESWVWDNPQMVNIDHIDYRNYTTIDEAFMDEGYEGCMGRKGHIIFELRSDTNENKPYIINDTDYVKDLLNIADMEWVTHCWGAVFIPSNPQ